MSLAKSPPAPQGRLVNIAIVLMDEEKRVPALRPGPSMS